MGSLIKIIIASIIFISTLVISGMLCDYYKYPALMLIIYPLLLSIFYGVSAGIEDYAEKTERVG